MEKDPDGIPAMEFDDAVRKRPGMYLGDTGRVGTARLIGSAVYILAMLTHARRDNGPWYSHHAFLDVSLDGRTVTTVIDHHPDEAPDIAQRCAALTQNRENPRRDDGLGPRAFFGFADLPVLSALTEGLHIIRSIGDNRAQTVLADPAPLAIKLAPGVKGAAIASRFEIRDQVDPRGLTLDFLEGFLEGRRMVGLVLRDIRVRHDT
ncbi:hypothetical protein [Marimonas arenosa]|uniref:Uncharacterized protein n=1 Tax=Marimonas arenosa TaxID=1795305 RepID=A0AAE4B419_9RHOB|nr:hypothetical protein [Marimonas arenosa]MDQ2090618.1 hypothetical protein [Marimonas arenosa]